MYKYLTSVPEKIQFFLQKLLFGVHMQKQHHNMPALFCNGTILESKQYTGYKVLKLIMQRNQLPGNRQMYYKNSLNTYCIKIP